MRSSILGVDCPATGTSSHFRATQAPSHRIASCLAPPSVSSTTSTATRHHQARQNISSPAPSRPPPRHWSYPAVPSSKPIPDRRLLLGVRVRSCLAWSDAGSGQSTVDSRQWTVDRAPSLRPKIRPKKNRRGPALRNPNRCRAACSPPATLHPPPGPTDAAPAIAKSEQRPRLRPPSPSPSPSSASPRASAAAKLLSPVVASRPSPVTRPCRSPPTRSCTHPRRPPPPPDCPPPSESIEPATRHHPASSPTPSTIATSRDPDHPSAP